MKINKIFILCFLSSSTLLSAQTSKQVMKIDSLETQQIKTGETKSVMLNASADNGPRVVNIGLPASVGGTTVLENGFPVTYDYMGMMATQVWRKNVGISKFDVLNVSKTALFADDVGVSVSSWTNRGTEKFRGTTELTTNSFGLMRADIGVSGPLSNGFYYSIDGYVNFDPTATRSNISRFLDRTKMIDGFLNKKYTKGQIGVRYKFIHTESLTGFKNSPYIYHENGKVDALPGFKIGKDAYMEQSGIINAIDPLTGKQVAWDAMKESGATSHIVDILGDHKFENKLKLNYGVHIQTSNSGTYNPYLTSIEETNYNVIPSTENKNPKRFYYVDNPEAPYNGLVQNGMMIFTPKARKNTLMAHTELSRQSDKHQWTVGLDNWYYHAHNVNTATYGYQFEVAPNPKGLGYEQWNSETLQWESKTDEFGNKSYNAAMQYYSGSDNKLALVATDQWEISPTVSTHLGTRLQWHRIDGEWYPDANRKAAGTNWVSGETSKIKKDFYEVTGTASVVWKAFQNLGTPQTPMSLGFLGDAYYIQQSGLLSSYAGADDPHLKKSEIPGFSAGVYFNHPMVNIVSKVTKIKRTNFTNNSTFNKAGEETQKKTITYDVSTLGWTTDALISPFKGFKLHLLLTLQNPKYENYEFDVFGEHFSNNGNIARSVSKTLIEIDPSYSFYKFNIWASARYFSKEYANYPNTLIFASRWETFAGINYKYDKNINFSLSAVNILNQSGAQGSISGSNTTTKEQAKLLYDKPLAGTYIRPFTVEFKTQILF